MTLKTVIEDDVGTIFQNTDEFAEPIQVINHDGSVVINTDAIVFRDMDEQETRKEGTFGVKLWRVFVSTIDVTALDRTWHVKIGTKRYQIDSIGEDDGIAGAFIQIVRDLPKERSQEEFRRIRR